MGAKPGGMGPPPLSSILAHRLLPRAGRPARFGMEAGWYRNPTTKNPIRVEALKPDLLGKMGAYEMGSGRASGATGYTLRSERGTPVFVLDKRERR